jgi:hypothetical protein
MTTVTCANMTIVGFAIYDIFIFARFAMQLKGISISILVGQRLVEAREGSMMKMLKEV